MLTNKKKKQEESRRQPTLITNSKSFGYVEAYKTLRTNLIYAADSMDSKSKVLLVTSSIAGEGKSSVSINLAIALAQAEKRVILIDCDLRKKSLYSYLRASRQKVGLSDYLQSEDGGLKVLNTYRDLGIDVMFAGSTPTNPSELLGSAKMSSLLRLLSNQYDFVVCDTPPLGIVSDALALGRFVDGAILIASYDQVLRQDLVNSRQQLESSNIPILGTVLNMYDEKNAVESGRKGYGYGYGYGYYSYYGYGDYDKISESENQKAQKEKTHSGSSRRHTSTGHTSSRHSSSSEGRSQSREGSTK